MADTMEILRSVTNRYRKLTNLLDVTIAQHADEMEQTKQMYKATYNRLTHVLHSIHDRKCHIKIDFFILL